MTAIADLDTDFTAMRQTWTASLDQALLVSELDFSSADADLRQLQTHNMLLNDVSTLESQTMQRRGLAQSVANNLDRLESTNTEVLRQRPLDSSSKAQRTVRLSREV
jgi:hypothetical protein